MDKAMEQYADGDATFISGVCGGINSISRGLAELSRRWLEYVEEENRYVYLNYAVPKGLSARMARMSKYTFNDYWEDDEILNERITGPISDADLRLFGRYGSSYSYVENNDSDIYAEQLVDLFRSTEYLIDTLTLFRESRSGLLDALNEFDNRSKPDGWEQWYDDSKPEGWHESVIPLLDTAIYQLGEAASTPTETDQIRQATLYAFKEYKSEIRVSGWKWLFHVQETSLPVARAYLEPQAQAIQRAQNIYFTVQGLWDRYSILNPEITGYLAQHEIRRG